MSEIQRFPLSWPAHWKRTPYGQRKRAMFWRLNEAIAAARKAAGA